MRLVAGYVMYMPSRGRATGSAYHAVAALGLTVSDLRVMLGQGLECLRVARGRPRLVICSVGIPPRLACGLHVRIAANDHTSGSDQGKLSA